jgi:flagellar biosynthesis protein FlhA
VILVSQVIRGYFSKMITQFYPNVYVLAFNEITGSVQIQSLGNITLGSGQRGERRGGNTSESTPRAAEKRTVSV